MSNVYTSHENRSDNLLLMGQIPAVTDTVKVCAGNSLGCGSVVGLKSDTNEAYLVDKTKSDGTQIPYGVIAETSFNPEPYEAVVYISGEFNADALVFLPGFTVEDFRYDMNKAGLVVRDTQNRGL